jgi:hypothetical protein
MVSVSSSQTNGSHAKAVVIFEQPKEKCAAGVAKQTFGSGKKKFTKVCPKATAVFVP